jgi:YegS/Rv2252/BmrU family lipid kinase
MSSKNKQIMTAQSLTLLHDIYVILNPVAGSHTPDEVRTALRQHLTASASYEIYETTGEERIADVVRDALETRPTLVIVAGGDGTVASVATGMQDSDVPLGILPVGTANMLARELGIPTDLDSACALLTNDHTVTRVDAMQVGEQRFFLRIGIGLDALMIRDTTRERKQRFGRAAYGLTLLRKFFGYQPRQFYMVVDDQQHSLRAGQVIIANSGGLGDPEVRLGPNIRPDDGHADVCVVFARSVMDYLKVFVRMLSRRQQHSYRLRYFVAQQAVKVQADRPVPVAADGEMLEPTPLHVQIIPHAVKLIIPPASDAATSANHTSQ